MPSKSHTTSFVHYEIPPEVSDYIIDHVWDSKPTLASCSLVCRVWANRSRHHLFRVVDVAIKRCSKLDKFIAFLRSSPHLASSIRHLTLHGTIADDQLGYTTWFYVTAETLLCCVDQLAHIVELSLRGVRLTGSIGKGGGLSVARNVHQGVMRPVQRLLLSYIFADPDVLFQTMQYFPKLHHLFTEAVYWTIETGQSNEVYSTSATPLSLETITVGGGSSHNVTSHLFPRLERNFDATALRYLALHFDRLDSSPETSHFMACAGPRLEGLHITIGRRARVTTCIAAERLVDTLRLDQCTALVEFGFNLEATFARSKDPSLAWSLLGSIAVKLPKSICRLVVTHRLDFETLRVGLQDWNWSSMDAVLSDKRLTKLTIRSPTNSPDKGNELKHRTHPMKLSEVFFRTSLPRLSNAHVLTFETY
ncbi:hypothetical protein BDY19DRAFT_1030876 [Irpex rosettiformis]|uniref:Uncharacterized protein n=1 Tax=Irpex rosettiformis TaxID=378272 RepID=A0ACB8UB66_9APHY|nr:hypothetical protein BDY19DRAFT_1030876 [Irpex rosettiformis]